MKVTTPTGTTLDLGSTEAKPTISMIDYSERQTDAFGTTTVVKRDFSRRMSVRLGMATDRVDFVQSSLANLRATAAFWVADHRFAWLSFQGYYEDFSLDIPSPAFSYCSLTVAGLAEREIVADQGGDPAPDGALSTLRLLQPETVDDAVLTSSSLVESDYPMWSPTATYAAGATVAKGHRVFESLVASNTGADPATEPGKWLDTGPTNRWAMFDEALGTSTIASSAVEIVLKAGKAVTALALLDTNAAEVRVRAPGYDRAQVPNTAGQALFADLDVIAAASITVTVTPSVASPGPQRWDDGAQWMDAGVWRDSLAAGDGTVTIGTFLFGEIKALGITETSPSAGIIDYSLKEVDQFGEVTVVQRAWAKQMAVKALLRTDAVDAVADRIAAVRAQPCLWLGDDEYDSLIVYGFFRDFSIEVGENVSTLSLSIEGLSKAAPIKPANTGSVAWPDITDPTGTKPTDNADKTSENTSKDTNAVGGVPAASITGRLDTLVTVTIPAVEAAGAAAGQRITEARAAADLALNRIETEVERVDTRIDNLSASGGYDDTAVNARITDERELSLGREAALGTRIDTVSASLTTTDTNLRALITTKETAAVGREDAISQRIDQLIAEGGGGSEGVDTVARSEIQRVEQASVIRDTALGTVNTQITASADVASGAMNSNQGFAIWPANQPLPTGYGEWPVAYGRATRASDGLNINTNAEEGGVVQAIERLTPGAYVLEARVKRHAFATFLNTGLLLHLLDDDGIGTGQFIGFHFFDDAEHGVQDRWYTFSRYIEVPDLGYLRGRALLHIMGRYAGLSGGAGSANNSTWAFARVRAASAGEIKAQKADAATIPAISARVTTAEAAIADGPNRYASAQRASNIEAAVGAASGRIGSLETVTSNGTLASASTVTNLRSDYEGTKATVSTQAGTIAGLGQKTAAYVRIIAAAGNNSPAVFSLWSDEYGAAWALGGNGQIDGNLTINGTLTARAFNGASMAREASSTWSGPPLTPAAGQTISNFWSLGLPSVPPTGRFIYEYTFYLETNAGTGFNSTYNGKPAYTQYVEDGGGLTLSANDGQGHSYNPRPNGSDRNLATVDFAPTFYASIRRGSLDTGFISDGDNYSRQVAATYTIARIDLKVTWVAI